jgi:hypoxanthine phosphoribosyltransferase
MGTEKDLIERIIYSHEEIVEATKKLAEQINEKYQGKEIVLVTVMSGGLPFANELMKHINVDVYMDFVKSSSYEFDKKISEPKIEYDAKVPLTGREVIIIDEIVDSGETIEKVTNVLQGFGPASISVAALIVKPERIKPKVDEYYCFEHVEDDFLIGFGLD